MQSFLSELAQTLLNKYGHDLSGLTVMFPSRRARIFFSDAVANISETPVWQSQWTTVDELMEQGSGLIRGERIRLISELFKVYRRHHPHETFDRFYFWGDMLIADFDMIDKYLIDASKLLRNIEDIKELEADVSYLTPEQLNIIRTFWSSVNSNKTLSEQKQLFLKIWRSLPKIYGEYRDTLIEIGIGYPGLIYRTTAERIKRGEKLNLANRRYIIAGFNALSESEKVLFRYLSNSEKGAEFYWDYDNYYLNNKEHEAGMFLRENIHLFSYAGEITHDNFTSIKKNISSTACVSNIVQLKHISALIESIPEEERNKDTAIVLTDESLLIPLLHSLPDSINKINVTMGYPLKATIAYTFIERLISLQAHSRNKDGVDTFYHVDVCGILTHPYIMDSCSKTASELYKHITKHNISAVESTLFSENQLLKLIFKKTGCWSDLSQYIIDVLWGISEYAKFDDRAQIEYLRIAIEEVKRTMLSMMKCNIDTPVEVYASLLRRHLQTITIPYEGKPLDGIQVMGILETRNIDFKNVIILSMTDANFPGNLTEQPSFIPYSLRIGYELPTPEQHEAMYAYYFYRLIQRAERVDMLYCSRADDKSTGERSRYIYQMEYESPYSITQHSIGVDLGRESNAAIEISKGEEEMNKLQRYLDPSGEYSLSPTTLFKYVECPIKFYFSAIAHLRRPDELSGTIDALTFGNIMHDAMEELYTKNNIIGTCNPCDNIEAIRNEKQIGDAVDNAIRKQLCLSSKYETQDFSGDTQLVRDIVIKYILRGIMYHDAQQRKDYTIIGAEKDVKCQYPISDGVKVNLAGRADRIDKLSNGTIQIVDYKSNSKANLEFDGIYNLFNGKPEQRISNIFQTILYSMMLTSNDSIEVRPSLYYASMMLQEDYSPFIIDKSTGQQIDRYSDIAEEFENELRRVLTELFDPNTPFKQTADTTACELCDYKRICRR